MKTRVIVLSLLCVSCLSWMYCTIPSADAHDIQTYPTTSFVRIEDENFDRQYMQTGEILTVQGSIVSNVDKDIRGWASIFSDSDNANNRWEILARDPPDFVFIVPGNSIVEYSLSVKALEPGTYHIHSLFNVDKVGPEIGPGQTIVVQGEPIIKPIEFTNIAYQLIPIVIGSMIVITIAYYFRRKK